jgi:hypothetical protein
MKANVAAVAEPSLGSGVPQKPKSAKPGKPFHLSVMVDGDVLNALDRLTKAMTPGIDLSRTQVVGLLLREALIARGALKK